MTRRIVIDTDPGVDDALAIFLALASPELDVVGLTTIFGNAATDVTTRNALVLLEIAEREDVPVAVGESRPLAADYLGPVPQVHGSNGLGDATFTEPRRTAIEARACEFLYSTVAADPGAVTIVALGPLTNLARSLELHPDLPDLVEKVVVMGGNALVPGNATPTAEANINNDPEAADLVFGASWPVTMVGLDVTHQINLTGASVERITGADTPVSRLLAGALPCYRNFFETTNGLDGIYVHDPSTIGYLLDPEAFGTSAWPIRVETEGFSRGKTWPSLGNTDEAVPAAWKDRPLVNVCTTVESDRVIDLMMSRLAAG